MHLLRRSRKRLLKSIVEEWTGGLRPQPQLVAQLVGTIEFTFRDAKQYWGLEDFMNVTSTAVTNAANLALFMVNLVSVLLRDARQTDPQCSVLDLKAQWRGYTYVLETIKLLPDPPDEDIMAQMFRQVASLGRIHPVEPHLNAA